MLNTENYYYDGPVRQIIFQIMEEYEKHSPREFERNNSAIVWLMAELECKFNKLFSEISK